MEAGRIRRLLGDKRGWWVRSESQVLAVLGIFLYPADNADILIVRLSTWSIKLEI
jgi:hypothetical protein